MSAKKVNIRKPKNKGAVKLEELKDGRLYKVEWFDITSHSWEYSSKRKDLLSDCWTIGFVWRDIYQDKDVLIVVYGKSDDGEECFDAIPVDCVKNIYEYDPEEMEQR